MERKPATYADLEALPPNRVGELIAGTLYSSPRPASPHSFAAFALGGELYAPFQGGQDGPGGWFFFTEPELHFDEDVLVPDLAAWRHERMPEPLDVKAFTLAPDWVCEVRSPSTATLDRVHKMPVYAREGVRHVWLLDPVERMLEVFRLEGAKYAPPEIHSGSASVRVEPFEPLALNLSRLWMPGPGSRPR